MNFFYNLYHKYILHIKILQFKAYLYKFNNSWNIWVHSLKSNNWDISSYIHYYSIHNFIDFWKIYNNFPNIHNYSFFLFKNNIKPIYEDINNINGGYFSIKISNKNAFYLWLNLSIDLLTLNLNNNINIINGLSITKKSYFFIIKIWISNIKYNNINIFNFNNNIYHNFINNIKFTPF